MRRDSTPDEKRRQAVEDDLGVHKAYLDHLFEGAPEALVIVDNDNRVTRVNREFTRLFGYAPEEIVGRFLDDLIVPPDKLEEARQLTALDPSVPARLARRDFETVRRRKDGTLVDVSILGAAIHMGGRQLGHYVIYRDIGGRKRLEEQLRQSQKLEAIGRLAGGIAHDFNNLLTVISGYSELLLERCGAAGELAAEIRQIDGAARRAAALTCQLLAFSRRQVMQPKVIHLNGVVTGMLELLRRLIGENVETRTALARDLGWVKVDPNQVEQVILNLAINARDAMPRGGKLILETQNADFDADYLAQHPEASAGPHVMLAVSDTGVGMDPETRTRIFEPFFTTKGVGKGTGLGLAVVYGIVKQSGGHIWVYSEPGKGTTFKVYFPSVPALAEAEAPAPAPARKKGRSPAILVVEEDENVRQLTRTILERHGYTVLPASGAAEAEELCRKHAGAVELALIDMLMLEAAEAALPRSLQTLCPGLRVLYLSAYSGQPGLERAATQAAAAVVQKPFSPAALLAIVREALEGPAGKRV